jgi:hypothetical protein
MYAGKRVSSDREGKVKLTFPGFRIPAIPAEMVISGKMDNISDKVERINLPL